MNRVAAVLVRSGPCLSGNVRGDPRGTGMPTRTFWKVQNIRGRPCWSGEMASSGVIRVDTVSPPCRFPGKPYLCLDDPCDSVNMVGIQTITDEHGVRR